MSHLIISTIVRERRQHVAARAEHELPIKISYSTSFNVDRFNAGDRREYEIIPNHPKLERNTATFETLRLNLLFSVGDDDCEDNDKRIVLNLRPHECRRLMNALRTVLCPTCNGHSEVIREERPGCFRTVACPDCKVPQ